MGDDIQNIKTTAEDLAVERFADRRAYVGEAAENLGRIARLPDGVTRVDPLGTEAHVEVLSDLQAALLQDRQHDRRCRPAGVGTSACGRRDSGAEPPPRPWIRNPSNTRPSGATALT